MIWHGVYEVSGMAVFWTLQQNFLLGVTRRIDMSHIGLILADMRWGIRDCLEVGEVYYNIALSMTGLCFLAETNQPVLASLMCTCNCQFGIHILDIVLATIDKGNSGLSFWLQQSFCCQRELNSLGCHSYNICLPITSHMHHHQR